MYQVKVNNNNEYLERLTRTGPKLFSTNTYLSKFNAYNMNARTHTHTHRLAHARTYDIIWCTWQCSPIHNELL